MKHLTVAQYLKEHARTFIAKDIKQSLTEGAFLSSARCQQGRGRNSTHPGSNLFHVRKGFKAPMTFFGGKCKRKTEGLNFLIVETSQP